MGLSASIKYVSKSCESSDQIRHEIDMIFRPRGMPEAPFTDQAIAGEADRI
jgi:hypothetical protein